MLPAVRQALGLPVYHSVDPCQPHAWQLYRHISVYRGDNACVAGRPLHRLFACFLGCPASSKPLCIQWTCISNAPMPACAV